MHSDLTEKEIKDGIDSLSKRLREALVDPNSSPMFIDKTVAAIRRLEAFLIATKASEAAETKHKREEREIYKTADVLLGKKPAAA